MDSPLEDGGNRAARGSEAGIARRDVLAVAALALAAMPFLDDETYRLLVGVWQRSAAELSECDRSERRAR